MKKIYIFLFLLATLQISFAQISATINVNTAAGSRKAISPLIYGINAYVYDTEWGGGAWKTGLNNHGSQAYLQSLNITSWRVGGNAVTPYNWENGGNNSGADNMHKNSDFVTFVGTGTSSTATAEAIKTFKNHSTIIGAYPLLQLPAAGYVAADMISTVCGTPAADPTRWKQVIFDKPGSPGSLSLVPNLADGAVYIDEEINYLINQFGNSSANGFKSYEIDNEPGLWSSFGGNGTHTVMHPTPTTCTEILNKNIGLANTIKRMDATAQVFGSSLWGFPEYYSHWSVWNGAQNQPSDWATYNVEPYLTNNTGQSYRYNHMTWANAYLDKMKQAGMTAGKRLLDVFNIHYYPEGIGSDADRVQAPRSLWDPTYVETSYITQVGNGFTDGRSLELLPKFNLAINDFYPNTKLGITEYSFEGRHHISGALAQADALGIFGRQGVYFANYFYTADDFIGAGIKIFRNYDGTKSTFGSTYIDANTNDLTNNSVYASIENADETLLHLVLINKSATQTLNANISINSAQNYQQIFDAWGVSQADGNSTLLAKPKINALTGNNTIAGNTLRYALPPYAVYHVVLKNAAPLGVDLVDFGFSGSVKNNQVALRWTVANEKNFQQYEVERSADAIYFANIGTVAPNAAAQTPKRYDFLDKNPTANGTANNEVYYRLKMVDKDASFKYSNLVVANLGSSDNNSISISPNPTANNFTIQSKQIIRNIRIVNSVGAVVLEQQIDATNASISTSLLPKGTYFVQYFCADGTAGSQQLAVY